MKILIVEDNTEFACLLAAFLQEAGFETETAASGKEGVKAALNYLPDLILLDYHLGDMTGYDVATAIRYMRNTANIPFVLLSSLGADPMLINSFKKIPSCRATLVKTLPQEEILAAIRQLLPAAES